MMHTLHKKTPAQRLTEPQILFPLLTLVLLLIIGLSTALLINTRYLEQIRVSQESTREMAQTYHAQLLRALREIDISLAAVEFALNYQTPVSAIESLSERGLLPPDLLFRVSVYDLNGHLLASRPVHSGTLPDAWRELIRIESSGSGLWVSDPRFDEISQRWRITFARAAFPVGYDSGVILTISTDAEFFVSSYEESRLGEQGMLALINHDGNVLVRRSGEQIRIGDVNITTEAPEALLAGNGELVEYAHPSDNIRRYYITHQLFGFPLTLVAGVSVAEQMLGRNRQARETMVVAALSSLLIVVFMTLLGRYSYQLHRSRMRLLAEQIAHSQHVEHLAFHDSLTGLPNRSLFSRLLHQQILEAARDRTTFAVLFLDLDKFKYINDTLGHDAGDELLREVARRVRRALRESDVIARLGGDEFIILLRQVAEPHIMLDIAELVLQTVCQPYQLNGSEMVITVSIGISVYPADGLDEQTLIHNADTAMYEAKQLGRNQVRLYSQLQNSAPESSC